MSKKIQFTIDPEAAGTRLDRALSQLIRDQSRTFLQELIRSGKVCCNGEVITQPRYPVQSGMTVELELPEAPEASVVPSPEPFEFPILYEDAAMLVIDKPAGVVVHPAAGNPAGTVVNALLGRYPAMAQEFACETGRPGIVHRLDKDTSGCLCIAKTAAALFKLGNAFAGRETAKTYLALVRGIPTREQGEINTLIGRHPVNRQKMAVVNRNGKEALTRYSLVAAGELDGCRVSLLRVRIFTGRTHQIRVHLSHLGFPVLGDALYGGSRTPVEGADRQLLHAWRLALPHPLTGRKITFTAPVPADMQRLIDRLPDNEFSSWNRPVVPPKEEENGQIPEL